jgi:hypothetical protein
MLLIKTKQQNIMVLTDIKDFTAQEVGMWLVAQGMGNHADKFLAEGIDGDLLLSLTAEELKTDLGLPSLQAKKILKNIEFTQSLTSKGDGEGDKVKIHELEDAVKARDVEIEQLKQQLAALTTKEKAAPAPSPKHAPAPAPSHHTPQQQRRRGAPVVGGAARGRHHVFLVYLDYVHRIRHESQHCRLYFSRCRRGRFKGCRR